MGLCHSKLQRFLEPMQQGAKTPGGCSLAVIMLRAWTSDIEWRRPDDVVATIDLANAFGRAKRSKAISAMHEACPQLAPLQAWQWRFSVVAWQHIDSKWQRSSSKTGGWQGSLLSQMSFAVEATVSLRRFLEREMLLLDTEVRPAVIAIADDTYILGESHVIARNWSRLEDCLENSGHLLRRKNCGFWAPAQKFPKQHA